MGLFFSTKKTSPSPADWYFSVSEEQRREYDAFGPWIHELKSVADLPPRFRSFQGELAGAEMLLKIPVDKDRRSVRPGDDLYRQIWALDPRGLGLLEIDAGEVVSSFFPLDEIESIRISQVLLSGTLEIFLSVGRVRRISYNTVSRGIVEKLVDALLEKLNREIPVFTGRLATPTNHAEPRDDFFRSVVYSTRNRSGANTVVHVEEPGLACRTPRGQKRRGQGLLVLNFPRELWIVDRGGPPWKVRENHYGSRISRIPHARWSGFTFKPVDPQEPRAGTLISFRAGSTVHEYTAFGDLSTLVAFFGHIPD